MPQLGLYSSCLVSMSLVSVVSIPSIHVLFSIISMPLPSFISILLASMPPHAPGFHVLHGSVFHGLFASALFRYKISYILSLFFLSFCENLNEFRYMLQ